MSLKFPRIEDFFQPTLSPVSSPTKTKTQNVTSDRVLGTVNEPIGDGFTFSERSKELILSQDDWQPQQPYDHVTIGQLSPGPRRVNFTARVINLYDRPVQSKLPKAAKGCLKVLVRDDEATLLVNLWYARTVYDLRLGSLITIWTTHISPAATTLDAVTMQPASLLTSIFPERDIGCHIAVLGDNEKNRFRFRRPLGLGFRTSLLGLMNLRTFVEGGGSEVPNAKVLVYVKAIAPESTFRDLGIADGSCEAILHLFSALMSSGENFHANHTVLLISYPGWRPNCKLSIKARTQIDVDPLLVEADWLRRLAMQANQPINEPEVPWELFPSSPSSSPPLLHNLTTLSHSTSTSSLRSFSSKPFTAFLSLVITSLNLTSFIASHHLFSMPHCNMPIYANSPDNAVCGQCGDTVKLRINPAVVGGMVDETGCLGEGAKNGSGAPGGRLVWSDEAWADLFGRVPEEMARLAVAASATTAVGNENGNGEAEGKGRVEVEEEEDIREGRRKGERVGGNEEAKRLLKYLEERLTWMRVILLVGWTGSGKEGWGGGRLCVLRIVG